MGDVADRARTARAETPPLTSGHTLHWDGTGAVSQDGELPQDAAPAAGRVGRSAALGRLDRLPALPAPAMERPRAAALTLYLDAGLLLASGHTVLPGATGHLRWVPAPPQRARPSVWHPVLLVHTRDEALPVSYSELVLHLPRHDPLHRHIVLVLEAERDATDVAEQLYAQALADALVVHFLRRYAASQASLGAGSGGLPPYKLQRTTGYIQTHLEEKLALATLAAVAEMSPTHFAHLFKDATGWTPHQYVNLCRIAHAKRLLADTDLALIEVGAQVGCVDQSHFTALFRTHVATTPKAYRNVARRACEDHTPATAPPKDALRSRGDPPDAARRPQADTTPSRR
jgi:AraC-like DNA-binding protein